MFPNDDGKEVLDFCGKNRCYIMEVRRLLNGRRFEFKNTIKISILDFTVRRIQFSYCQSIDDIEVFAGEGSKR